VEERLKRLDRITGFAALGYWLFSVLSGAVPAGVAVATHQAAPAVIAAGVMLLVCVAGDYTIYRVAGRAMRQLRVARG
jgi:hypothetical protein